MDNSTVYFGITSWIGLWGSLIMANMQDSAIMTLVWFVVAGFWAWQWFSIILERRKELKRQLAALEEEIKRATQHES